MNRIRTTQGTIVLAVAALVFTGVLGAGVASAQNAHVSAHTLRDYQQWLENLSAPKLYGCPGQCLSDGEQRVPDLCGDLR